MLGQARLQRRYEITDTLGQGGLGVVYKAYDTVIRRDVALKTIRDIPDPAALETFHKECGVLASMAHPNIIEIFDLGEFEVPPRRTWPAQSNFTGVFHATG
jgi:serine/threonine protein kinase